MPITVGGTAITFNDGTTQSSAGISNTNLYSIGSFVTGRPANATNYVVNDTIAGSILYSTVPTAYRYVPNGVWQGGVAGITVNASLVNVGSWRCVSSASGDNTYGAAGLWVRYA